MSINTVEVLPTQSQFDTLRKYISWARGQARDWRAMLAIDWDRGGSRFRGVVAAGHDFHDLYELRNSIGGNLFRILDEAGNLLPETHSVKRDRWTGEYVVVTKCGPCRIEPWCYYASDLEEANATMAEMVKAVSP